jgi:prepilin-type N-terminal cleavage/methylation domain-containing protein
VNILLLTFLGSNKMKRKGFTLIELMIVIVIVAILAAILVPLLTAQVEKSKWAEAKAGCGTIATALRAYGAEYAQATSDMFSPPPTGLGMSQSDLYGKYFDDTHYTILNPVYNAAAGPGQPSMTFTIQASKPVGTWKYNTLSLTVSGTRTAGGEDAVWLLQ